MRHRIYELTVEESFYGGKDLHVQMKKYVAIVSVPNDANKAAEMFQQKMAAVGGTSFYVKSICLISEAEMINEI